MIIQKSVDYIVIFYSDPRIGQCNYCIELTGSERPAIFNSKGFITRHGNGNKYGGDTGTSTLFLKNLRK